MKIGVFEAEAWEREKLQALGAEHELIFHEGRLTEENVDLVRDVDALSVFIYSNVGKPILKRLKNLKLVVTRSTGVEHIDADYCKKHNITVSNVPTYGGTTVAEHVFALLLTISRRILKAADRCLRGDFSNAGLRGFELNGKTIGIVGTGDIGGCVVPMALGFGMKVIAFDIKERQELIERYGLRYVSMDQLVKTSDVITLHAPLNDKTRHMLDKKRFRQMKDGVVIINTARGELIDIEALVESMLRGKVGAAGLDVLPEEPSIRDEGELLRSVYEKEHELDTLLAGHILMRMRNVVITPHNAFNTDEALERILATTIENITGFAAGEAKNVIVSSNGRASPRSSKRTKTAREETRR